jgi:glycerophosphoryl diester phosphodiesterase
LARFCIANTYLLNIEIKPTPGLEETTGRVVGEHAARLWQGQAVPPLLSSFKPEALAGARATAAPFRAPCCWIRCGTAGRAPPAELGCVAIVCNHALWDAALVAQVQGDRVCAR